VVQDLFLNETAREFGTVFLPAASSFEKDGTFMNAERRIQPVRKALEPINESKPDWLIVCELARALGKGEGFRFESAEQIWEEIRRVWKAGAGISYARLEQGGLQWPCPSEDHPGTTRLHQETFPIGPRAALRRVDYIPTVETISDEYPFLLTTGRTLYQFNAGTMTQRTRNLELRPTDWLDLCAEDATMLTIRDGDRVRIRSRHGAAALRARITSDVKPGELFATFHFPEIFLNHVTGPVRDRTTLTPEYKVTAVLVERLSEPNSI
jgi:formate dehydrogenase major subunit